jgi:haloalkane dehalogenase
MSAISPPWLDRKLWPYPVRFTDTGDGPQAWYKAGSGPAVVLVHGTPTWSLEWRHVIADLAADHRVIAVDHLGFGQSAKPKGAGYMPEDHARRFDALMQRALPDGSATLVLHDFGGPFALPWVLANWHRVSRLVLVNSFGWTLADDPAASSAVTFVNGAIGRFLYLSLHAEVRWLLKAAWARGSRLTPEVHAHYLNVHVTRDERQILFALARSFTESREWFEGLANRLPELANTPTDLIWGMGDRLVGPTVLARWRQTLPHAHVAEIADAGHWPHEEQPDAFIAALRNALDAPRSS